MDQNETPIEFQDFSLGKEIARSFAVSTATTAGVWAGLLAVGYAYMKVLEFNESRKAKNTKSE